MSFRKKADAIETGHFTHDFGKIPVDANLPVKQGVRLRTAPDAAEKQADEIAERVATPEPASEGVLPGRLTQRLEQEVGGNFRSVRVHADAAAAERVAYHRAEAMSEGRHLYFAPGRWRPDTKEGALLAAHEAVHAAQQGFAEHNQVQGQGRYFKKPPASSNNAAPPKADPRDIFEIIETRAPDMAVFVSVKTIDDVIKNGSFVEGPAVPGGTNGQDVHEWHVSILLSQQNPTSHTDSIPKVTTKKTKNGQLVKHVVSIDWGTLLGSRPEYQKQGTDAESNKALPAHAPRAKDFAFELMLAEPLIHELLHARIIMEKDPSFTGGPHTQEFKGYLDTIAASQSAGATAERDAVRTKIGVLALMRDRKPGAAEINDLKDSMDEFLVHEKFDSQKIFGMMSLPAATNQKIAKSYTEVIWNKLTARYGDTTVSDAMDRQLMLDFAKAVNAYYDAIDTALAKPGNPATQPAGATPPPSGTPAATGSAKGK